MSTESLKEYTEIEQRLSESYNFPKRWENSLQILENPLQ